MSKTELMGETPDGMMRQNIMKEDFGWEVPVEAIPLPSRGSLYNPDSVLYNRETLKIKSMTAHEEDILASPAFHKEGTVISQLIKSCLVDKSINPEDLILGDRISLMVGIRVTGYGPSYKASSSCPNCGHNNKFEADLSSLEINRLKIEPTAPGTNDFEYILPVTKKKVTFKYLTGGEERRRGIESKNKTKALGSKIENNITSYLESTITSVDGIRDRLKIKHFIKNMPAFDSKKLRAFIVENEPGINMKHSMTCQNCGTVSDISLPITTEFFWPST
jgi:hypothetical protein|tara:strand:- start:3026 stop:3856 length:831 start_codon:yes stop_codon:yes gene_type:complete